VRRERKEANVVIKWGFKEGGEGEGIRLAYKPAV